MAKERVTIYMEPEAIEALKLLGVVRRMSVTELIINSLAKDRKLVEDMRPAKLTGNGKKKEKR